MHLRCTLASLQLCISSGAGPAELAHPEEAQLVVACQDATLLRHSYPVQDAFLFPARQPPAPGSAFDLSVIDVRMGIRLPSSSSVGAAADAGQRCAVHPVLLPCSWHLEGQLVRGVLTAEVQSAAVGLQASPSLLEGDASLQVQPMRARRSLPCKARTAALLAA